MYITSYLAYIFQYISVVKNMGTNIDATVQEQWA